MRRLFALTLGLGLLSASGYADVIDFTPYAGYTTVSMGSVNKAQSQYDGVIQEAIYSEGGPSGYSTTSTGISGAWIVGADILSTRLTPCDDLSLGLRGEYLATNQASSQLSLAGSDASFDATESGTLSSFMLGGRYQLPGANHGLSLSAGVFGGLGYGTMAQSFAINAGSESLKQNGLFYGEGFVGDLDLRLDWAIPGASWLHLDAQGGYRYASLGDFSNSRGQSLKGPSLGDLSSTFPPSSAVDVDFSGLTAEGGLSVTF